jgi:23S rRNA (pseudouridine1915-N3)-methyltransferase
MSLRLRVLAVSKRLPAGLAEAEDEWLKRARSILPVEVLAVRDAKELWAKAKPPLVILDERGRQLSSVELATWIGERRDRGASSIDFLIGDAHGFDDAARARGELVFGLSRLTLPHRLARLLLVEQLYRAGTILAGHPYHHE